MRERGTLGVGLAHCWPSDVAGELASLQGGDGWRAIHLALNQGIRPRAHRLGADSDS
jgi:hypothetical protein